MFCPKLHDLKLDSSETSDIFLIKLINSKSSEGKLVDMLLWNVSNIHINYILLPIVYYIPVMLVLSLMPWTIGIHAWANKPALLNYFLLASASTVGLWKLYDIHLVPKCLL